MTLAELIAWAKSVASADDVYYAAIGGLNECDAGSPSELDAAHSVLEQARESRANLCHATEIVCVARAVIKHISVPPERHFGRTQWDKPEGQS